MKSISIRHNTSKQLVYIQERIDFVSLISCINAGL